MYVCMYVIYLCLSTELLLAPLAPRGLYLIRHRSRQIHQLFPRAIARFIISDIHHPTIVDVFLDPGQRNHRVFSVYIRFFRRLQGLEFGVAIDLVEFGEVAVVEFDGDVVVLEY